MNNNGKVEMQLGNLFDTYRHLHSALVKLHEEQLSDPIPVRHLVGKTANAVSNNSVVLAEILNGVSNISRGEDGAVHLTAQVAAMSLAMVDILLTVIYENADSESRMFQQFPLLLADTLVEFKRSLEKEGRR